LMAFVPGKQLTAQKILDFNSIFDHARLYISSTGTWQYGCL